MKMKLLMSGKTSTAIEYKGYSSNPAETINESSIFVLCHTKKGLQELFLRQWQWVDQL